MRTTLATLALSFFLITPLFVSAYDVNTRYYGYPSCTISITNYAGSGHERTATVSWTSRNAERVYISGIGSVGHNGAMAVTYPKIYSSYTMTVSNSYTSSTCSTSGSYYGQPTYNYPTYTYGQYPYSSQYPYVTLNQIPYTGFGDGAVQVAYAVALASLVLAALFAAARLYSSGLMRIR